ncbi:ATP-binding protein [Streptomyces sp. V1I6]|uniref:ATP-binding protein n=1 Tax=Streptomyces sp. V1I6 TaxID=3042273 RepID=UPI0027D8D5AD|nr:ATP-binding protein [Streptomyces sp. V1I6]
MAVQTFSEPARPSDHDAGKVPETEILPEPAWPRLSFASKYAAAVAHSLGPLRPEVPSVVLDGTKDVIEGHLSTALETAGATGTVVIHILSHGRLSNDNRLHIAATESTQYVGTMWDVSTFIADLEDKDRPNPSPNVLLFLDVCHAGGALSDAFLRTQQEDRKVFIIAACPRDENAYAGNFSSVIAAVLADAARNGLGVDPSVPYIPLEKLVWEVRLRLNALSGDRAQSVYTGAMDAATDLPFLRNLVCPQDRADLPTAYKDRAFRELMSFVEGAYPSLDLQHYLSRVHGGVGADLDPEHCHFAGRSTQLGKLARWISGEADAQVPLVVVTGEPGSGKSALLGALVCCAHPYLARQLHTVVNRIPAEHRPPPTDHIAVVHARKRTLNDIVTALTQQLHLAHPQTGWTPHRLIEAVADLPSSPLIVVDALDEATERTSIAAVLLTPLARVRASTVSGRPAGTPACRLLVGTRPWWKQLGLTPLEQAANELGRIDDLDTVPTDTLIQDLTSYLTALLAEAPRYTNKVTLRGDLARAVAQALVKGEDRGEFLKARLYARHLAQRGPTDLAGIGDAARGAPRRLRDVLQLDPSADQAWVLPVLATVAWAEGEGMSDLLIRTIASAFDPNGATPTPEEISAALAQGTFYLRSSIDPEHRTTLYQLFHQGLADDLRNNPVLDAEPPT